MSDDSVGNTSQNSALVTHVSSSEGTSDDMGAARIPTVTNRTAAQHEVDAKMLPSLDCLGTFDGRGPAYRWLQRIKWEFRRAGVNEGNPEHVAEIIKAINMQCEGRAALFLDSNPTLLEIVTRANDLKTRPGDLLSLEQAIEKQFPPRVAREVTIRSVADELKTLTQTPQESLRDYRNRAQTLLGKLGAREPPLLPAETPIVRMAIDSFVNGLLDAELKSKAIGKNAKGEATIWACYMIVRSCQEILEEKRRIQMKEKLVVDYTGLAVEQALAESYPYLKHKCSSKFASSPSCSTMPASVVEASPNTSSHYASIYKS